MSKKKSKLKEHFEFSFSAIQAIAVLLITFIAVEAYLSDIPKLLENRLNAEITESKIDLNDTKLELRALKSELSQINTDLAISKGEADLYYSQIRRDVLVGTKSKFELEIYGIKIGLLLAKDQNEFYEYLKYVHKILQQADDAVDVYGDDFRGWLSNINANNAKLARKGVATEDQMAESIKKVGQKPELSDYSDYEQAWTKIGTWKGFSVQDEWHKSGMRLRMSKWTTKYKDKEFSYDSEINDIKIEYTNNMQSIITGTITGTEILNKYFSKATLKMMSERHRNDLLDRIKEFEIKNSSLLHKSYKFKDENDFSKEDFVAQVESQLASLKKLEGAVDKLFFTLELEK